MLNKTWNVVWIFGIYWSRVTEHRCKTLVHAFVTSRLEYCNSLLYGLPKYLISKLQRAQNAVARLITNTRKYDHIIPALHNLHWLPVFYRIYFKILIITFKAIYNMSPSYINNLVSVKSCYVYSLRILHYFFTVYFLPFSSFILCCCPHTVEPFDRFNVKRCYIKWINYYYYSHWLY